MLAIVVAVVAVSALLLGVLAVGFTVVGLMGILAYGSTSGFWLAVVGLLLFALLWVYLVGAVGLGRQRRS